MKNCKDELKEEYSFFGNFETSFIQLSKADQLTKEGQRTMFEMGKRASQNFGELLNVPSYSPLDFHFRSTSYPRVLQSAQAFAYSLFEGKGPLPGGFESVAIASQIDDDLLLRFFANCKNYESNVLKNETAFEEATLFYEQTFPELIRKLNERVFSSGRNSNSKCKIEEVWSALYLCQLELINLNTSQTCSIFSEKDLEGINYYYDLLFYWKRGYPHKISFQISNFLLSQVLSSLSTKQTPHSFLYFAHAETLLPLFCLLGLFNDSQPLLASNQNINRTFQTRQMIPFSSNLQISLFECPKNKRLVGLMVNEKQVELPFCGNHSTNKFFCDFDFFSKSLNFSFDLNKTCGIFDCQSAQNEFNSLLREKFFLLLSLSFLFLLSLILLFALIYKMRNGAYSNLEMVVN